MELAYLVHVVPYGVASIQVKIWVYLPHTLFPLFLCILSLPLLPTLPLSFPEILLPFLSVPFPTYHPLLHSRNLVKSSVYNF